MSMIEKALTLYYYSVFGDVELLREFSYTSSRKEREVSSKSDRGNHYVDTFHATRSKPITSKLRPLAQNY